VISARSLTGHFRGSRTFGFGSRRVLLLAAAGVVLVAGGVAAGLLLTRPGSAQARYGGLPSWLPKTTVPVGRVRTASEARPWLAVEGDTVSVGLPHGRVLATAVGPEVPEEGRVPVPRTSRCTFIVTFARATGAVPISSGAFTILDEQGRVHRPHVTLLGGGPVPARLPARKPISLKVWAVLPTGSGTLRWTPVGHKPLVSWDFDVEID
jgi:hypothetical protein